VHLTPTLKIKRNNLTAHLVQAIEGMYQKSGGRDAEAELQN
jgi:long-chain acyl-CoA synthetase